MREIYFPPFKAAVDEGVLTFMSAFNDLNGVPASGNAATLTGVLRGEWGFKGLVVSDWDSVAQLIPHGFAADGREAAQRALTAGVDMEMTSRPRPSPARRRARYPSLQKWIHALLSHAWNLGKIAHLRNGTYRV